MTEIESIVIMKWPRGFVAHLRFGDSKYNVDISTYSKPILYSLIEAYLIKKVGLRDARI